MKDKAAVGADLYLEDSPDNIEPLREDGHKTIVFANSTNSESAPPRASNWQEVVSMVQAEIELWKKRGKANKESAGV
jgi:5'(3')-deoxyribonucleotidase